jgi:predicted nucleotidyltransferase
MRTLADGRPVRSSPPSLEALRRRRAEILAVCARRGASNVRVFGSVVRNQQDADSDLDLLVEMEAGRSLFDLGGLLMDLEELLGCPVDVMTDVRDHVRTDVQAEAVAL